MGPDEKIWRECDWEEPMEELRETEADLRSESPTDKKGTKWLDNFNLVTFVSSMHKRLMVLALMKSIYLAQISFNDKEVIFHPH